MTRPPGQPTSVVYEAGQPPKIEYEVIELAVVRGPDEGATVRADRAIVVGTHRDADLRLADRAISRRHAELRPVPGGLELIDLDSTNGTFVGGAQVRQATLRPGAVVELGRTAIEVRTTTQRRKVPLSKRTRFGGLIGESTAMRRVFALLERAATSDVTVLLEGETGTGKELAARALRDLGSRSQAPFVVVDCSAVATTLIESEIFGHAKGAFTGADSERPGAFETASGGTVFLDEIGELPLTLQPKLLRVLQEREVRRIGEQKVRSIDVRIVAATNRDLAAEVAAERFREDLYYRIAVFRVTLPPLREHPEDIPLLVRHFLGDKPQVEISQETMRRLQRARWPGNARELRNAVERALILSSEDLDVGSGSPKEGREGAVVDASRPFKDVKAEIVTDFERDYIAKLLERTGGNVSRAAREAGIDRKHLERLLRKHRLRGAG